MGPKSPSSQGSVSPRFIVIQPKAEPTQTFALKTRKFFAGARGAFIVEKVLSQLLLYRRGAHTMLQTETWSSDKLGRSASRLPSSSLLYSARLKKFSMSVGSSADTSRTIWSELRDSRPIWMVYQSTCYCMSKMGQSRLDGSDTPSSGHRSAFSRLMLPYTFPYDVVT